MALKYETVVVTPELAEEWLETMGVNRRISDSNLSAIVQAMNDHNWHDDGTPIRFDTNGQMIDGQHRCMAISMTGRPRELLVVRGVKPEAMSTIDTGKSRSRADVMSIFDPEATDVAHTSGVATIVLRWKKGARSNSLRNTYVSNDEFLLFYSQNKEAIVRANREGKKSARHTRTVTAQAFSMCAYLFEEIDPDDAQFFWDRFRSGQGLEKGSPILALRNALERSVPMNRDRFRVDIGAALIIKAWNAYREGRNIELLRFKVGGAKPEQYPEPV